MSRTERCPVGAGHDEAVGDGQDKAVAARHDGAVGDGQDGPMVAFRTTMFEAPRTLKLCSAAWASSGLISL